MKKTLHGIKNVGCTEAPGVVFADHNISSKLPYSPRKLIASLKSTKLDCKEDTVRIHRMKMEWTVPTPFPLKV